MDAIVDRFQVLVIFFVLKWISIALEVRIAEEPLKSLLLWMAFVTLLSSDSVL